MKALRNKIILLIGILTLLLPSIVKASTYVAFSLNEAEKRLEKAGRANSEVMEIGGITQPMAIVYDKDRKDLIIVGEVQDEGQKISLNDFVVALRSIIVRKTWPLVSIDKTDKTKDTKTQMVRFEGGIAGSNFGKRLFQADVLLKKMGLGEIRTDIWGVKSYFDMFAEHWEQTESENHVQSRFWYKIGQLTFCDREGVVVIGGLRLKVDTQVMSIHGNGKQKSYGSVVRDEVGQKFAEALTANHSDISQYYEEIKRLDPLFSLVGLSSGIQKLFINYKSFQPKIDFWLYRYKVSYVETPENYPLIMREAVLRKGEKARRMTIDGGIEVRALLSELKDGTPSALREIVVISRPNGDSLTWKVPLLEAWPMPATLEAKSSNEPVESELLKVSSQNRKLGCSLETQISPLGGHSTFQELRMNINPSPSGIPEFRFTDKFSPQRYSSNVGGVMLRDVAKIEGDTKVDLTGGNFSLIIDGQNARLSPDTFKKFVTALWSVYYSKEDPGISIDPIAPNLKKHLVRYIGKVINNDLGKVMREADYMMKKWAVGTEKPDVVGFRDVDALMAKYGFRYIGASRRFWFIPEEMKFKRGGDMLLFEDGRMTVKTEYVFQNKGAKAEPADEAFAKFFTNHYQEIAEKYPVYKDLFEYAKFVSLAKYLKEKGVPLFWFSMANMDLVITEDSPGTVDALAKGSDYWKGLYIEGGVNLGFEGKYVYDQQAVNAINEAISKLPISAYSQTTLSTEKSTTKQHSEPFSFDLGKSSYTVVPQHSLTSGKDRRGIRYQTDFAFRHEGQPGLELVRYYNPRRQDVGEFGKGWNLMIPYKVAPYDERKIEFLNALIPEKMVVVNLLTGREEVLTFSKDRYSIAGYVPDDLKATNLIGLFLLSNASFRLADKLGNEFQFDQGGHLTEMIFSKEYHVKFEYGYRESKREEFTLSPYRIEPIGNEYENFLNVNLPKRMKLIDLIDGKEEILVFSSQSKYGMAGYMPVNEAVGRYKILAIMTDGSFVLGDKQGREISFNPAGRFETVRSRVVKGIAQGNYRIEFDHEFKSGEPRIKEARIMKKDHAIPLHVAKYEYGQDHRLCKVTTLPSQKAEMKDEGGRIKVARN